MRPCSEQELTITITGGDMSGKNAAMFVIDPTHDSADADALRAKGFRSTDISVLVPHNLGSKDPTSAPVTAPSAPPAPIPARAATIGPAAALRAPDLAPTPSADV